MVDLIIRRGFLAFLGAAVLASLMAGCDRVDSPSAGPQRERVAATQQRASMDVPLAQVEAPPPSPSAGASSAATISSDALSDTVITAKIKAAILTDPGMTGADVSVSADRGAVMLAGTVKSQEQIAIASAHAQRQDGVTRVDSHLSPNPQ